ncbi:MAG: hypothetical protein KC503_16180 [Myxococcales bacterium]|nr:hypothetical protein [Myxococcales bacterium]
MTQLGCNCYPISVRPARTYAACVCALLLVGSQLAGLAHRAFVEHRRCAEHGKLVHADDGHDAAGPRADRADHARLAERPSASAEHEHDHCQLTAPARATVTRAAPKLARTEPPSRAQAPPVVAPLAQLALWRRAPKTSPPA